LSEPKKLASSTI